MRLIRSVVLLVTLSACVSSEAVHSDFTSNWVGRPIDDFTIKYGIGGGRQRLNDGRTVIEWSDHYGVANTGAPIVALGASIGGAETQAGSFQLSCQLRIIVGTSGRIEQVIISKDTIGRWVNSRCAEVLKS